LSDRILIAENWCAALFVSTVLPDSETAALQCGRAVDRATVHPPGYMDKAPRLARCRLWRTHAPSSLQNIRLSADVGNPLSRSRNSWAVGDRCVGLRLLQMLRRQRGAVGIAGHPGTWSSSRQPQRSAGDLDPEVWNSG